MSYQLMTQTQVSYSLALTRTVKSNDDMDLSILPLVQLTTFFFWLWSFFQTLNQFYLSALEWSDAISQLLTAVDMVTKVYQVQFEILFTSFKYGFSW